MNEGIPLQKERGPSSRRMVLKDLINPLYLRELATQLICLTLMISKGCMTKTWLHPVTQPEIKLLAFQERLVIQTKLQQKQIEGSFYYFIFTIHLYFTDSDPLYIDTQSNGNHSQYTKQMLIIPTNPLQLLLLAIAISAVASLTHLSAQGSQHMGAPNRHLLNDHHHDKLVIHHDMRVFNFKHETQLQHDTASQNYGLNDMGYFFSLNLTIANLTYSLNIDTGSSDLFIKGEHSKGNPVRKFSCPRCLRKNQKVSIGYLDGFLNTYKITLPVQLGQHKFNQSILVAYTAPHNFHDSQGLVGLSFPEIARNTDPTFLQTLINNKIIQQYSFGVNLNFQQHQRSFISFGSFDSDLFEGQLKKYTILPGYTYTLAIKGVSFGEGDLHEISTAILDTGNTCISIDAQFEQAILNSFNTKSNKCAFDNQQHAPSFSLLRCKVKNYDELPVLKIHIEADILEVDKDVYMQRCIKKPDADWCDIYIESVSTGGLYLGDGFFNRYYTYFDIGRRQIGFAKNKENLSYKNMVKDESVLDDEDKEFFQKLD